MDRPNCQGEVHEVVQHRMVLGLKLDTQHTRTKDDTQTGTVIVTAGALYVSLASQREVADVPLSRLLRAAAERLMRLLEWKTAGQGRTAE